MNEKQGIDGKARATAVGNSVSGKEPAGVEEVTKPTNNEMVDLTSSQTHLVIDSPRKAPVVEKEILKTPIINSTLRKKNIQNQAENVGNDQNIDAKGKGLTIIPSRLKRKEMVSQFFSYISSHFIWERIARRCPSLSFDHSFNLKIFLSARLKQLHAFSFEVLDLERCLGFHYEIRASEALNFAILMNNILFLRRLYYVDSTAINVK